MKFTWLNTWTDPLSSTEPSDLFLRRRVPTRGIRSEFTVATVMRSGVGWWAVRQHVTLPCFTKMKNTAPKSELHQSDVNVTSGKKTTEHGEAHTSPDQCMVRWRVCSGVLVWTEILSDTELKQTCQCGRSLGFLQFAEVTSWSELLSSELIKLKQREWRNVDEPQEVFSSSNRLWWTSVTLPTDVHVYFL